MNDDGMTTVRVVVRPHYKTNTVIIYKANRQWGYGPDDAISWPEPLEIKEDCTVDFEEYLDSFIGADGFGPMDIGDVKHVEDIYSEKTGRVIASRWTVEIG